MKRERVWLLAFIVTALLCLLGGPVYAGTQNTGGSAKSPDVAGSGNQLSSYSDSGAMKTLGIDTSQPGRTDGQGNPVNKNENPFGTSSKIVVGNTSVATAGIGDKTTQNFKILDVNQRRLIGGSTVMNDTSSDDWSQMPKTMTSANIIGTAGYQQVLTAVLVPRGSTYDLELVIEDYNGGASVNCIIPLATGLSMPDDYMYMTGKDTEMGFSKKMPSEIYKSHFRIAACAGRVAILVDRTLYDYKLTGSGSNYSATLVRKTAFDSGNSLAPLTNSDTPMIDLKSGDPNLDGLQELVLTVSSAEGTNPGRLLIYKWENNDDTGFSQPLCNLDLGDGSGKTWTNVCAALGNVTGSGDAILVAGYDKGLKSSWEYKYVDYDLDKGKFTAGATRTTDGITYDEDANVKYKALPDLTCVSFSAPQPGAAQYVFYDGYLLQYDTEAQNLVIICPSPEILEQVRQDISYKEPQIDIIYSDMAVGTLLHSSTDKPGVQQLAVLVQDSLYGTYSDLIYFVYKGQICSTLDGGYRDSSGYDPDIMKHYINEKDRGATRFVYPALTAVVVKDKFFSLKFDSASFAMSDPKVIAVLGASPYYKEFQDEYGNGWGNEATTYGTSEAKGSEQSNALTLTAGVTIGVDEEVSAGFIVSQKVAEFELLVNVSDEFTAQWSKAQSVTVGRSFSAVADDMVVISSIPYDIYKYRVCDPGQADDGRISTLYVPYEPRLSLMNLSDYNEAVAKLNEEKKKTVAAPVPASVLMHTVGDPRSYQSSMNSFSGIDKKSVVTGGDFLGVGTGNGLSEQSISTSAESSTSFNNSINLEVSFTATIGPVVAGASRGAGYDCGATITNGSTTELSGSVVNLPPSKQNYDFTWKLVGYKAHLDSGDFPVVNYLVKTAEVPPPVPQNLQLLSYGGTSAVIAWDAVNDSSLSQYLIYRSTSKDIDTTKKPYDTVTIFPKTGQVRFSDLKLESGREYYYAIVAEDDVGGSLLDSAPSEVLAVPSLITGLAIKTQPQLEYNEGDLLDLSSLVLTATMSDASTQDLSLSDFKKRGMSFSIPNGTVLSRDDDGVPVYITDPATRLLVVTDPLKVTEGAVQSSFTTNISFTVGSTDNATQLAAGQRLTAHIGITNSQSSPQSVIAVVALFDSNNTMCNVNYSSETIAAGASRTIDLGGFVLPSPIEGYTARAFVMEGTQFNTSSLRPLSNIGQIGATSSGTPPQQTPAVQTGSTQRGRTLDIIDNADRSQY